MCNAATAYASSAGTDIAAYDDLPGYHLLVAKNLIAIDDESYHGSDSKLPPPPPRDLAWVRGMGFLQCARSGDVPTVPRCRGLLVQASYTSSTEGYDPARECFTISIGNVVDGANAVGAGDGEDPRTRG
jgi:hypothetical protein